MSASNKSLYPPYTHDWRTSANATWIASATLVPMVLWSSMLYGSFAVRVWVVSIAVAMISEAVASGLLGKWTLGDGSAVLTGLLIASAMPPGVPWYVPASSAAFAIFIVKAAFGGLGSNWMNPALAGLAFAYGNWPMAMRQFLVPKMVSGVDGVSASTPLYFAKGLSGGFDGRVMDALRGANYPLSSVDTAVTAWLNDTIFSNLGARLPAGYIDLALGFRPGTLGESALLIVLLGSLVLISLRLIRFAIPVSMLGTFMILVRVFGSGLPGEEVMTGDVLFALSGGGVMLAAFYMATDPVSSPVSKKLCVVYGAAVGTLTFIFRRWGACTESVAYAVLIMNVLTPFLEQTARASVLKRGKVAHHG